VIVFGSRDWTHRKILNTILDENIRKYDTIIHGDARGADRMADDWGKLDKNAWVTVESHPADWQLHGKRAGYVRNKEMLDSGCDLGIGFLTGATPGSMMMLNLLLDAGKPVIVVKIELLTAPLEARGAP
jgi:hypothetical protein